jgi:hypothetical protein
MCRTCCHENIGGNVTVAARPNAVNRFFRFKNRVYDRVRKTPKYAGFYFSPKYAPGAYPRSAAGGRLTSTDEILAVARNSTDSDICRPSLTWTGICIWRSRDSVSSIRATCWWPSGKRDAGERQKLKR